MRILPRVINDAAIGDRAFRVFAILLDAADRVTAEATITLERLALRLRCSRKTAWLALQELKRANHIAQVTDAGDKGTYKVLSSVMADTGGVSAVTPTGVKSGCHPCQNGPGAHVTGDTHPNYSSNISPKGEIKTEDDTRTEPERRSLGSLVPRLSTFLGVDADGKEMWSPARSTAA